jgi:hypothetical protein
VSDELRRFPHCAPEIPRIELDTAGADKSMSTAIQQTLDRRQQPFRETSLGCVVGILRQLP